MISFSETITKSPTDLTAENGRSILFSSSLSRLSSPVCFVGSVSIRLSNSPDSATKFMSPTTPNFLPVSSETTIFPSRSFPLLPIIMNHRILYPIQNLNSYPRIGQSRWYIKKMGLYCEEYHLTEYLFYTDFLC